jgi:hypothetical protein
MEHMPAVLVIRASMVDVSQDVVSVQEKVVVKRLIPHIIPRYALMVPERTGAAEQEWCRPYWKS